MPTSPCAAGRPSPALPRRSAAGRRRGGCSGTRLEWDDATRDALVGNHRFSDGVAVQLPIEPGGDVPDAAMGQVSRRVRIHLWKASRQDRLERKDDAVAALYPNAVPDYPFSRVGEPARAALELVYAPARAAGNPITRARPDSPTEDLIAEGFGSLTALEEQTSLGRGVHDGKRWRVTIARPLDGTATGALRAGARTYVAFAVWDGARGEVGARKMRSGWTPLELGAKP